MPHPPRHPRAAVLAGVCLTLLAATLLPQLSSVRSALFPVASAQDQAPNRRDFTIVGKGFRYSPDRIEVTQDDLVKVTLRSDDIAYSFTIDDYRIARRVPPGGTTTFEFRADRAGTFPFYSNLTSEPGHAGMKGVLVVRPK